MTSQFQRFAVAGLLAASGLTAFAQAPAAGQPGPGNPPAVQQQPRAPHAQHMKRHDPARMQAAMAKRQAALKQKLQITPAQEGAWSSFTTAIAPQAGPRPNRPDRAAFEKMTTPQRIDRMRALHAERQVAMDRRGDAVKTFYATLSPQQQSVFDTESLKFARHAGPPGARGEHRGERGGPRSPRAPANSQSNVGS